jgi:hypothetical protein
MAYALRPCNWRRELFYTEKVGQNKHSANTTEPLFTMFEGEPTDLQWTVYYKKVQAAFKSDGSETIPRNSI